MTVVWRRSRPRARGVSVGHNRHDCQWRRVVVVVPYTGVPRARERSLALLSDFSGDVPDHPDHPQGPRDDARLRLDRHRHARSFPCSTRILDQASDPHVFVGLIEHRTHRDRQGPDVLPVAIVLDVPVSVAVARNRSRPDRDFGAHVVKRHHDQLRRSLQGLTREGFRKVHVLSGVEEVDSA